MPLKLLNHHFHVGFTLLILFSSFLNSNIYDLGFSATNSSAHRDGNKVRGGVGLGVTYLLFGAVFLWPIPQHKGMATGWGRGWIRSDLSPLWGGFSVTNSSAHRDGNSVGAGSDQEWLISSLGWMRGRSVVEWVEVIFPSLMR